MEIEDLRLRLFGALASSLAMGCGPAVGVPDAEADSQAEGSEDDATTSSGAADDVTSASATASAGTAMTTASTSGMSASEGDDDDDDGVDEGNPKFDTLIPDSPPIECLDQPSSPVETCAAELPGYQHYRFFCVEPEFDDCETWAAKFAEEYPPGTYPSDCLDGDDCSAEYLVEIGCGPLPEYVDQCCFWFVAEWGQNCPGRPFLVAGCERLADATARADWSTGRLAADALAPAMRRALADVWTQHALFEHASIASFSRFTLHLLACGAPAELVLAANVALGEEIRHAQLFFGFASHYAGAAVGPTALDVRDSLSASSLTFAEIVLSAVREGCIAETISAWHVALAARGASDPAMARALDEVAAQELEHAALAWRFLDWAWAWAHADEDLRARIVDTFANAASSAPRRASSATALDDATMLAHGILPAELHDAGARQVLRDVVAPAAQRFLATRQRPRSGSSTSKSLIIASTSAMPMRT